MKKSRYGWLADLLGAYLHLVEKHEGDLNDADDAEANSNRGEATRIRAKVNREVREAERVIFRESKRVVEHCEAKKIYCVKLREFSEGGLPADPVGMNQTIGWLVGWLDNLDYESTSDDTTDAADETLPESLRELLDVWQSDRKIAIATNSIDVPQCDAGSEIATSSSAAAEVCVQTKNIASQDRVIDEVATMSVVRAVDRILDYVERVQLLREKWREVEAAGWLRGYRWEAPVRLASTATGSALEQAQANCRRICRWVDENCDTDRNPHAPLSTFLQEAIDRGDDLAPFITTSIEAIKRRIPVLFVIQIDDERRYILEANAQQREAIAADTRIPVSTETEPARNTAEDNGRKPEETPPPKETRSLRTIDEEDLPYWCEIADLHLRWLEANRPRNLKRSLDLDRFLKSIDYSYGPDQFKALRDHDRQNKNRYGYSAEDKKPTTVLKMQKKWFDALKTEFERRGL